jgi:hypothetical protein
VEIEFGEVSNCLPVLIDTISKYQMYLNYAICDFVRRQPEVSEDHIASFFRVEQYTSSKKAQFLPCFCWFLSCLNFNPEDGGDMLHGNVGSSPTAH